MLASTTNKNYQTSLKPYSFEFNKLYNSNFYSINYQEYLDLKDLQNASIKELTIGNSGLYFDSKFRLNLMHLLRNTNIKKIILKLDSPKKDHLLLISKLIRKNTTIKEIELTINLKYDLYIISRNNSAWFYFIDTISNRLVKLNYNNIDSNYFDSLLLRSPNLKEIEINYCYYYTEAIKDVLLSKKYLDDFRIKAKKAFNSQFYDSLSKIKTKVEIDTLHIDSYNNPDSSLAIIENAYLFNVKTIKISEISELKVIKTIFKLSNNPLNTVERVIINYSKWNSDETELKSLNLKDYNLTKLPKIYLNGYLGYQELILDETNDDFLNFFKNYKYKFYLILRSNSIKVNNLTELLYCLSDNPTQLREFTVDYNENDMELKNAFPQYLVKNRKRIILGMKKKYHKFKVNKIQLREKNKPITKTEFNFKNNISEINFVYFTVLEIMVLMKIKIENLILEHCPISDLVEFLEKHKSLDSVNINYIELRNCETIDKENIEKLYQYSHLIKNQISIHYNNKYFNVRKESVQRKLLDIFHSKSRNFNNFVKLSQEVFPFMTETLELSISDLPEYTLKIKKLKNKLKSYNDIYFSKHINNLTIENIRYDLEFYVSQFSFLKEYEYDLGHVSFYDNCHFKFRRSYESLLVFLMVFETICNSKYRPNKINHFQYNIEHGKLSKKFKRYLIKHNLFVE